MIEFVYLLNVNHVLRIFIDYHTSLGCHLMTSRIPTCVAKADSFSLVNISPTGALDRFSRPSKAG